MEVHLVTETYPPEINGVAMTLERLVRGLAARGHLVTVIRPRQGPQDHPSPPPGVLEYLRPGMPVPGYKGLTMGLPGGRWCRRHWQQHRPDVVHVATEGPLGVEAVLAARRLRIPLSSSFHTNFHAYSHDGGLTFLRRLALWYLCQVHNACRATFVPTPEGKATLARAGFRGLRVMGRGVDTRVFDPARRDEALRASWGADPETPVALYVGRIAMEKNLPLTIEAFETLRQRRPDLRCVLVGDGPEREPLQARYPHYLFAGARRGEDLARHYASGDFFLFSSVTETYGNVVPEALASGVPVVAYDYAAAHQLIRPGVNGFLAPKDDGPAFLEATRQQLAAFPISAAMRQAARDAVGHLSWDSIYATFEAGLQEVARQAAEPAAVA